eukprot:Skav229319  [mRNA]  locus=scaffold2616:115554:117937:+ [translate_table: standard]
MGGNDEDLLPADIKKEVKQKVEIHYTASANGVLLDTSCTKQPIKFTMGSGNVMEAWDRIVSTMRKAPGMEQWELSCPKGEISRFTVPEMYLTGGPSQFLAKLPDDGQEVDFDIELVNVVGIRDIFGHLARSLKRKMFNRDGTVIERIHDDGEEYGVSPKAGDELQINYELSLKSTGKVLDSRPGMDFRTGVGRMIQSQKDQKKNLRIDYIRLS